MSLTELAFILFFLLLLLSLARDIQRKGEISDLESEKQILEKDSQAWLSLSRTLRDQGIVPDEISDDFFNKLVREAEAYTELGKKNTELISELMEVEKALQDAESASLLNRKNASECARQVGALRSQCGVGPPSCWVSPERKTEYIYSITLLEDAIRVDPAWPKYRESDLDRIPRARELPGIWKSQDRFSGPARAIRDWSRSQKPECRLYVRLHGHGDFYKDKRLFIEDFFYKYEPRR